MSFSRYQSWILSFLLPCNPRNKPIRKRTRRCQRIQRELISEKKRYYENYREEYFRRSLSLIYVYKYVYTYHIWNKNFGIYVRSIGTIITSTYETTILISYVINHALSRWRGPLTATALCDDGECISAKLAIDFHLLRDETRKNTFNGLGSVDRKVKYILRHVSKWIAYTNIDRKYLPTCSRRIVKGYTC